MAKMGRAAALLLILVLALAMSRVLLSSLNMKPLPSSLSQHPTTINKEAQYRPQQQQLVSPTKEEERDDPDEGIALKLLKQVAVRGVDATTAHNTLPPDLLVHENWTVGAIARLCRNNNNSNNASASITSSSSSSCLIMDQWDACNNNGPMPLATRSWMHPALSSDEFKYIVYASSHNDGNTNQVVKDVQALVSKNEPAGPYQMLNSISTTTTTTISLPSYVELPCYSWHSPSVVVDDSSQTMYMYLHAHRCKDIGNKLQPTFLFISRNGMDWMTVETFLGLNTLSASSAESSSPSSPSPLRSLSLMVVDVFYLTRPILYNGSYYALGKSQETSIGSAVLCKGPSLLGPFEKGPLLLPGVRHADVYLLEASSSAADTADGSPTTPSALLVFFTMIGDAPEHVKLGTINLQNPDWKQWKLTVGPSLLFPTYEFEGGMVNPIVPSGSGPAKCDTKAELRDPHFLPDLDGSSSSSNGLEDGILSGTLFYTVQGERAIAAS